MDTVEELKGTYFYKGMFNLSAGVFFSSCFWMRRRNSLVWKM